MTTPPADTDPATAPRRPWYRRHRYRIRAAQVSLLTVVAALAWLAATDRANIKTNQGQIAAQQAELDRAVADLDRQRRYDCLLFAARAYQQLPPDAAPFERCLVIGAAAAVDNASCLSARPVRPDLDTSAQAQADCLALAAAPPPPGR